MPTLKRLRTCPGRRWLPALSGPGRQVAREDADAGHAVASDAHQERGRRGRRCAPPGRRPHAAQSLKPLPLLQQAAALRDKAGRALRLAVVCRMPIGADPIWFGFEGTGGSAGIAEARRGGELDRVAGEAGGLTSTHPPLIALVDVSRDWTGHPRLRESLDGFRVTLRPLDWIEFHIGSFRIF